MTYLLAVLVLAVVAWRVRADQPEQW